MRVLHIITGLGVGGAETMLRKLLATQAREQVASHVIALRDGPIAAEIRALGVAVEIIEFTGARHAPAAMLRLIRAIRAIAPDLVQTWMYHGDLIGGLAAKLARPRTPVIWNIRLSEIDPAYVGKATRAVIRASALLSHVIPEAIIVNADKARHSHSALGYAAKKFVLIPNGFDTEKFRPDNGARTAFRDMLGIRQEALVIGIAGRFDPQKDYANFFAAGREVCAARPDAVLLACGEGVSASNPQLLQMTDGFTTAQLRLLGRRSDMPQFWAALDIAVSSSIGEGFSNAIGEAMCAGVPCVVTDVGDSARIVSDTGRAVPARDSQALAQAILALADMPATERQTLGALARAHMVEHYGLPAAAEGFFHLWQDVLSDRSRGGKD